jgi:hypothetical protein
MEGSVFGSQTGGKTARYTRFIARGVRSMACIIVVPVVLVSRICFLICIRDQWVGGQQVSKYGIYASI